MNTSTLSPQMTLSRFGRARQIYRAIWCVSSLIGLVVSLVWLFSSMSQTAVAQNGCSMIYDSGNGWAIETCATDPNVTIPMDVTLNGIGQGTAVLINVYHQSQNGPGNPQVAAIYASGYIRLKQNADPVPSIPFGGSFILGPAYWSGATYYHNPQLTGLTIDTSDLPYGSLRLRAMGNNQDFDISYDLTLPPPLDRQTRLHVSQIYTATTAVTIDPVRRDQAEGFKLVQFSSMFINEGSMCDGGHSDCHDNNAARFIEMDQARREMTFTAVSPSSFIFNPATPTGSTWLDLLHTDNQSWQGNTPNLRIALDTLPTNHTVTPQGWLTATTDPTQDNVGLWLHDDGDASQSWLAGQQAQVDYWLLAQDNPPDPWNDLELRSGETFLDFEGSYDCGLIKDGSQSTSGTVQPIPGYSDTALQLAYDLGSDNGNWVQIRCDFDPPVDLSNYDHLRFDWLGDLDTANSIEVGLINPDGNSEHIFARGYGHVTHHSWWNQLVVPFPFLHSWDGANFNASQVSAFFVSVVKQDAEGDVGGVGQLAIDNLNAYNVTSRSTPTDFEAVTGSTAAALRAVNWLTTQQQSTGLLKSWQEEVLNTAHTYDQALALLAFVQEGMWPQANSLVAGLAAAQNGDGSWCKSYDAGNSSLPCIHTEKWLGDIAWATYALSRYLDEGGSYPQAAAARDAAAAWLKEQIDLEGDGCLNIDHTEGTIDVWWALQTVGPAYAAEAQGLQTCLLTYYWDEGMGRFKGGPEWYQPYLDNQTWGSAFLTAVGEPEKARRALSYAHNVLQLPAQGNPLFGFDGQAGPWSVWNEGTGQYIAAGGEGANDFLLELLAQQRSDGAMINSPDSFAGGGVWTERWHGVAPTAWFYFANSGGPFSTKLQQVEVSGVTEGKSNKDYTFTAYISPLNVTQPVTYTWQADNQTATIHTNSNTMSFTWATAGTKTITVTVANPDSIVTDTHTITISKWFIYLPMIEAPIPSPTLHPITNNGDGNYSIIWELLAPDTAHTYILQEDDDPQFSSPNVQETTALSYSVTGRVQGTYYYRVKVEDNDNVSAWSNIETAVVDHLTIDDFDDGQDPSSIHGTPGWAYGQGCPQSSNSGYTDNAPYGGHGVSYYLSFNADPICFAVWQTQLLGKDYQGFSMLTFQVKGALGGERPNIYLQDKSGHRHYINIEGYLDANKITQNWQEVRVPLVLFTANNVDLSDLDFFQIAFEWESMSGTIYIDEIRFE